MAKTKSTAANLWVPQSRQEATDAIARIGKLQREFQRMGADMNDRLAKIKQKFEEDAAPIAAEIEQLHKGVQTFCEANRAELTQGGKTKTVNMMSGEVHWRIRPPSVTVRAADVVLETLRKMGLSRFIRTKEEINKEAILADPGAVAGIKGISVTRDVEDFLVEPFEAELQGVVA